MAQAKPSNPSKSQGAGRRGTRGAVLRRPPERGLPRLKHWLGVRWSAGLEAWQPWVLLFLAVTIWCLLPRRFFEVPQVKAGTIAGQTYKADRDLSLVNEAATADLRKAAEEEAPPVYDLDRRPEVERDQQLGRLFAAGRLSFEGTATPPELAPEIVQQIIDESGLKEMVTSAQVHSLAEREFATELEERLKGVVTRVLQSGVVSDRDQLLEHGGGGRGIMVQELPSGQRQRQRQVDRIRAYPDQVRDVVEQAVGSWGLRSSQRALLTDLVMGAIEPNLTFNSSESLALQKAAADKVGAVTHNIRKGEVIVRQGDEVDELAALAIAAMAGTRDQLQLWIAGLGTFLLVAAASWFLWLVAGLEGRPDKSRVRLWNECLILLMLYVLGARFAFFVAGAISEALESGPRSAQESYVYGIPFAALTLLAMLLYGRGLAFVLALAYSLLVGHIAGGETIWTMTLYSLAGSLAAIFVLERYHFTQRQVMIWAGTVVGLVNLVSVLVLKALTGKLAGELPQLGFDLVCAFTGGLLVAGVTSFAVPIFENLLGATTHVKLLELANTNLPLLRRLALEAPGTFQHSLAVSNLAKSGCEAIDLDSVLTHTAALYHDIGKTFRPQYFIENQVPGQNPHDKIQPSMSALILINHVKEGLELATKRHLPKPIIDAIGQHHGTHLIKFFYNRAQERCDPETDEVREDDFRYPGPKPQSKEMGILMLADMVEAASRTLVEPSRQKIRGLVRTLLDDSLKDRQLDHTDLTLGDLSRVEEAFVNVLTKIYHRRVDYPGFDFNQPDAARPGQKKPDAARSDAARSDATRSSDKLTVADKGSGTVSKPRKKQSSRELVAVEETKERKAS